MTRYQRADPAALEELVRRISPPLLRYFAWLASAGSRNDAEDLLQDCWIRIHRSRHTYRASEPLMPWIYAIARHTRLDAYRKRGGWNRERCWWRAFQKVCIRPLPEAAREQDDFDRLIAACRGPSVKSS